MEKGAEKRKPALRVFENDNGKCSPHQGRPCAHAVIGSARRMEYLRVHSEYQSASSPATLSMKAKIDSPRSSGPYSFRMHDQIHYGIGVGKQTAAKRDSLLTWYINLAQQMQQQSANGVAAVGI